MSKIMIFGGAGSLGTELTKFYINNNQIVCCSTDEAKHWELRNKFRNSNLKTLICDVRDDKRVMEVLLQEKPNTIVIAHAMKQIDICEINPEESVKTNISGIMNIANAIQSLSLMNVYCPEKVCFVSTDKAANPISVYGMCKSISERIIMNLSNRLDSHKTKFVVVRYGNVLCSKGSIIPLLTKQAIDDNVKSFTLTHELMTRFIMSLPEAVMLIDTAINEGKSGELWVPKLPSMKILDLIRYFSEKYNKPYEIIGLRGIEKIHEIMTTENEAMRAEVRNNYFVINDTIKNNLKKEYSSSDYLLSSDQLSQFMDNFLKTLEN